MSDLADAARALRQAAAALMDRADTLVMLADQLAGDAPKITAADVEQAAAAAVPGPIPTDREEQLVKLVHEHGAVSPGFAAQALNVPQSTIAKIARTPIDAGWVEGRGATKSRHYCVPGWDGHPSTIAGRRPSPAAVIPPTPDTPPDEDLYQRVRVALADGPADERFLAHRLGIPQIELRVRLAALVTALVLRVDRHGRYELLARDSHRSDTAA